MNQSPKVEIENSDNNHMPDVQLNAPSNNQLEILPTNQIMPSVHGQQMFVHPTAQGSNKLFLYGSQNNQQLQLLQLPIVSTFSFLFVNYSFFFFKNIVNINHDYIVNT